MPRKSTLHIIYFIMIYFFIMSSVFIDPKVNVKIKLTLFSFFIDLNQVRRYSEFNMDENKVVRDRFTVFTMAQCCIKV